jgi:hypothetical protein
MSLRLLASGCDGGDCPSIHLDEDTREIIVRGPDAADPSIERDLRYSAETWRALLAQL